MNYSVRLNATKDEGVQIGDGSCIWHFVRVSARIAEGVPFGQNA